MLPITGSNPFKWRHYPGDIIMWCVRWYLSCMALRATKADENGLYEWCIASIQ